MSVPDEKFWFEEIELGLGVWRGSYQGTEGRWLRWYSSSGEWIPTAEEKLEQEQQRAERLWQQLQQSKKGMPRGLT